MDRDEIEILSPTPIPPPGNPEILCRTPGCYGGGNGPDWFTIGLIAFCVAFLIALFLVVSP